MALGSQGSSDLSLEGFRGSPGVIWSAPGALWGHVLDITWEQKMVRDVSEFTGRC